MSDYERTMQLVNIAQNSAGRSSEQFAKYADTVEYKVNQLSNTWEKFRTGIVDSDAIKGSLGFLKGALNTISSIMNTLPGKIALVVTGFAAFKKIKDFLPTAKNISQSFLDGFREAQKENKEGAQISLDLNGEKAGEEIKKNIESSTEKANSTFKDILNQFLDSFRSVFGFEGKIEIKDQEDGNAVKTIFETKKEAVEQVADSAKKLNEEQTKEFEKTKKEALTNITALIEEEAKLNKEKIDKDAKDLDDMQKEMLEKYDKVKESAQEAFESFKELCEKYKIEDADKLGDFEDNKKKDEIKDDRKLQDKIAGKVGGWVNKIKPYIEQIGAAATVGLTVSSFINEYFDEQAEINKQAFESAVESAYSEHNLANADKMASDTKALEEAVKNVRELQGQSFLSEKKQTELNESIELLKNQYPQFISAIDENTGVISLLNETIDEEIEEQKKINESAMDKEIGQIATDRERGYQELSKSFDKASWSNSFDESIDKNINEVSTGITVVGAIIGSVIPILGTLIGAAVGAAVGGAFSAYKQYQASNTLTREEYLSQIKSLSTEDQKRIVEGVNDKLKDAGIDENIKTMDDLSDYLNQNINQFATIIQITQDILGEISKEKAQEDRVKATQEYMQTWELGKDGEIKLSDKEVQILHPVNGKVKLDAENTDLITEWEKNIDSLWSKVDDANEFFNPNAHEEEFKYGRDLLRKTPFGEGSNVWKEWSDFWKVIDEQAEKWNWGDELKTWDNPELSQDIKNRFMIMSGLKEEEAKAKWDQYSGKGIDETGFQTMLKDLAYGVFSSINLKEEADKKLRPIFEDFLKNEKNEEAFKDIRKYENIANLMSTMSWSEIQKNIKAYEKEINETFFTEDPELNKAFREYLIHLIRGEMPNSEGQWEAQKGGYSYGYQQYRNVKPELEKYFGDISSFSAEAVTALANTTKKYIGEKYSTEILDAINNAFALIPEGIDDKKAAAARSLIAESLTPENFDPLKFEENKKALNDLIDDSGRASKIIETMWNVIAENNLDMVTHSAEELGKALDNVTKSIKSVISNFKSGLKAGFDMLSPKGNKAEDILSLIEGGYASAIDENGNIDLAKFVEESYQLMADQVTAAYLTWESARTDKTKSEADKADLYKEYNAAVQASNAFNESVPQLIQNELDELEKKRDQANKNYNKGLVDQEKQLRKVEEAEKAVYEAYHGSPWWVPTDGLVNLKNELEAIQNEATLTEKKLVDVKDAENALDLVNQQNDLLHQESLNAGVQKKAYERQINEIKQIFEDEGWSKYIDVNNGAVSLYVEELRNADMPDLLKDQIREQAEVMQKGYNEIAKIEQDELDRQQKITQKERENRQKRLSFMQKGAELIQQEAEKEVQNLKDKYDAMKEVDDDYLDALQEALDKQKKLREQEESVNNLAKKEKKLSLMSRDTSGANEKERLKLQEEVEKDRQQNLDSAIDLIVDELKKQNEEREKEREAIIEAKEAVKESTNWLKEFTAISQNWTTLDEALNWFDSNSVNWVDKTLEEIAVNRDEFEVAFTEQLPWLAEQQDGFKQYTLATLEEIDQKYEKTSEDLAEISRTNVEHTKDEIQKNQKSADEALADAKESLDEMITKIKEYEKEQSELNEQWLNISKQRHAMEQQALENTAVVCTTVINDVVDAATKALVSLVEDKGQDYITYGERMKERLAGNSAAQSAFSKSSQNVRQDYMNQIKKEALEEYELQRNYNNLKGNSSAQSAFINTAKQRGYNYDSETGKFVSDKKIQLQRDMNSFSVDTRSTTKDSILWEKAIDFDEGYAQGAVRFRGADDYYKVTNKSNVEKIFTSEEELQALIEACSDILKVEYSTKVKQSMGQDDSSHHINWKPYQYKTGGLINYTGPAWVDGTPANPESFLSAEDTRRIGEAARLLSLSPLFNNASQSSISPSIGDTSIEININVENISDDYDVDKLVERVQQDILDAARPVGAQVIMRKN